MCRPGTPARRPVTLFNVLEALLEQTDNVLVVERVEHHPAVAPRPDQPHVPQQPQLMGNGRFGQVQTARQVLDAELRARERVEQAHARQITEGAEGFGQRGRRGVAERLPPHADLCTYEQMLICAVYRGRGEERRGPREWGPRPPVPYDASEASVEKTLS
jgi:hypothetical protein